MAYVDTASDSNFDTATLKKLSLMRIELDTQQNYANVVTEMITFYTLTADDNSDMCESLREDLATAQQCMLNLLFNWKGTEKLGLRMTSLLPNASCLT